MNIPNNIQSFWDEYLTKANLNLETALYDIFHFDDNEIDANELAALVIDGTKKGTASLLWEYETGDRRQPRTGDLSVVTNWDGAPLCIIETAAVEIVSFEDVNKDFAADEGEGDLSLAYWKDVHWTYFGRVCEEIGKKRSLEMLVVCERFVVVYPLSSSSL